MGCAHDLFDCETQTHNFLLERDGTRFPESLCSLTPLVAPQEYHKRPYMGRRMLLS